jgi:DNA topoisomerase I
MFLQCIKICLFFVKLLQDLNDMMKDYMEGLSVKVFRTYNASITLNRLLFEESNSTELVEKKADYDRANKEV